MHLYCSQSIKGEKAMAQQKWKRTNVLNFSPGRKKKKKEDGGVKTALRFNVMKHNICDRLRSGREDVAVIRAVQ